jgi:hypothetical protein
MDTIEPPSLQQPSAQTQQNNNGGKPLTGFQLHPENINRKGNIKREWTWKSLLEEAMEEELKDGKSAKHFVAKSLIRKALSGDVRAIEVTMDRMDGKPDQKNTVDGNVTVSFHSSLKQDAT